MTYSASEQPINPRVLLAQPGGYQRLEQLLVKNNYVPPPDGFRAMTNAIRRAGGIIFEGHRGGGKTAFPEALAAALNLKLFVLSCLDNTTTDEILFSWDRAAQSAYVNQQTTNGGLTFKQAQQKQWTLDFLNLGEVLDAFLYATQSEFPPVLLVDEIDKLSSGAETAFLQLFARGFANIPKLRPDPRVGFIPEYPADKRKMQFPIVVLTSNNMGSGVSSPLLSRLRFAVIGTPDLYTIIRILSRRIPQASPLLLYQTSKLVYGIMGEALIEKPALREFIEFYETIFEFGHKHITVDTIRDNLDCIAKTEKDLAALTNACEKLYQNFVNTDDAEIKQIITDIRKKNVPQNV